MTAPFVITTDQDGPAPVRRPQGPLRTEDPRTHTFTESDGVDAYVGRDELGFPVYTPIAATAEEQHAQTVEGLRRELQGCERRLLELDHMRSHRPPPPEWAFEDAEKAKANVLAELERLDPPKTIKKERK